MSSSTLQDLRRAIYVRAKADPSWRFWGLWVHICKAEISDLPAPDGPFIHPKAAERSKRLFVTASSRFRGRQLSSGGCATH